MLFGVPVTMERVCPAIAKNISIVDLVISQ